MKVLSKLAIMLLLMPATITVPIISPATNAILAEYHDIPTNIVTMMITLPALSMIVGLILSPILVKKIPAKTITLAGLLLYLFCCTTPIYIHSFALIFAFRFLAGVGSGMVVPLHATYAAAYPEDERASILGLSTALVSACAAALVVISGYIALTGWRYCFFLYFIMLLPIILGFFLLPDNPVPLYEVSSQDNTYQSNEAKTSVDSDKKRNRSLSALISGYLVLMICNYLLTSMMGVIIPQYLNHTQLGNSAASGYVLSCNLIGSFMGGVLMHRYTKITGKLALPIDFLFCSFAAFLLGLAGNLFMAGAGVLITGLFASMVSTIAMFELSKLLPLESFTPIASACGLVTFVMQFISPQFFLFVLTFSGSFPKVFTWYGFAHIVFVFLSAVIIYTSYKPKRV